jgi:8-oxo-dGTP pyrophosphatase MutT (NUDIX family)
MGMCINNQFMYPDFAEQVSRKLSGPLPGHEAHQLMASRLHGNIRLKPGPDSSTRESAVLILFYPKNNVLHLPLILRPVYSGVHSGQVGLPGGRVEPDDLNINSTALREAHEEIGIDVSSVKVLGRLSELFVAASNHIVHPIVGITEYSPLFNPDPREVDQMIEVSLQQLQDKSIVGVKNMVVGGNIEITAPYFDVAGHTVWGATAMILSELLMVIE